MNKYDLEFWEFLIESNPQANWQFAKFVSLKGIKDRTVRPSPFLRIIHRILYVYSRFMFYVCFLPSLASSLLCLNLCDVHSSKNIQTLIRSDNNSAKGHEL